MDGLSLKTLMTAVQGVNAEIFRIKDTVDGDLTELEPDDQDMLLAYSQAATELKAAYLERRRADISLPRYEDFAGD